MTSTRSDETVARWQATAELQPLVKNWWMMAGRGVLVVLFGAAIALEGIVSVVLGVLAFAWPFLPRGAIGALVAWGLLTGICETAAAVRFPRELAAHWLVVAGGAPSIFLALVVLALPHAGSDRVALALAAYVFVFGIVILLASLRLRLAAPTWRSQRVRL